MPRKLKLGILLFSFRNNRPVQQKILSRLVKISTKATALVTDILTAILTRRVAGMVTARVQE